MPLHYLSLPTALIRGDILYGQEEGRKGKDGENKIILFYQYLKF